jgi:hypothetical protein
VRSLQDYIEEYKEHEQTELIDIMDITSEDLLDRFDDRFEWWYDNEAIEEDDLEDEEDFA